MGWWRGILRPLTVARGLKEPARRRYPGAEFFMAARRDDQKGGDRKPLIEQGMTPISLDLGY